MDNPTDKYSPFKPIDLKDRKWPNQLINKTPIWCSVDYNIQPLSLLS